MLKISAVSYINAKPFVYGIEHSGFLKDYSLSLDIPSVCAEKLVTGKANIGLAPVEVLTRLKDCFILPDYCIGADGPVLTVMLYSEVPLKEIKTIFLDYQSRTSSVLVQILAKHWWKIAPEWKSSEEGYENNIRGTTGALVIGDRNFSMSGKYRYSYDLAEEWKSYTGMPFVFACWIAAKKPEEKVLKDFSEALKFGVENRGKVIDMLKNDHDQKIIAGYLNKSINYGFDRQKQKALDLFLKLSAEIHH